MTTAIVCTALLAVLMWGLSIRTSKARGAAGEGNQMPTRTDDPLFVAMRAHGNATENIPMLAVLFLLIGSRDPAAWMEVLMVVATVARFGHAFGVISAADMSKENKARFISAVVTALAGLGLAGAALVVA